MHNEKQLNISEEDSSNITNNYIFILAPFVAQIYSWLLYIKKSDFSTFSFN